MNVFQITNNEPNNEQTQITNNKQNNEPNNEQTQITNNNNQLLASTRTMYRKSDKLKINNRNH